MASSWPRYEPVVFTTAIDVSPEDIDTLNRARLPRRFLGGDMAVDAPVGVDVPGRGYLIRFTAGRGGGFYFSPSTGEVLYIDDRPEFGSNLVNSTLEQFTNTVKALIEAFPYYADFGVDPNEVDVDTLVDMYEASAARLAALIGEIDPAALTPETFWDDFLVAVVHGNYSTESILGDHDPETGRRINVDKRGA